MTTTVVQFNTAVVFEGSASDLPLMIDGNDLTRGTCVQPVGLPASSSVLLKDPTVPPDTVVEVSFRAKWRFAALPNTGEVDTGTIYSREGDGNPWTVRRRTELPVEDNVTIPVVNLADLQILVENHRGTILDPDPDQPPVS